MEWRSKGGKRKGDPCGNPLFLVNACWSWCLCHVGQERLQTLRQAFPGGERLTGLRVAVFMADWSQVKGKKQRGFCL